MTNKSMTKKTLTEERIANHKFALFASAAVSFAINLLLIILLAVDGISFGYIIFPILICVFDAAFIAVSVFVNFRFSYSMLYTIIYSVLFIISSVVYALILINFGNETAMSYVALGLWALVSLVTVISIIIGTSGAGKARLSLKSMVSMLVLCLSVGVYSYIISDIGFFGQGGDVDRPITFVYDSKNEYYVAKSTVKGDGNVITVPETFNGVKVGAIDCGIFSADGVDKVVLATAPDVTFLSPETLASAPADIEILAGKAIISSLTSTLYTVAYNNPHYADSVIAFTRNFSPSDLTDNEVYITFSYDSESILSAEGKHLPMWIGEKNQIFKLDSYKKIPYVAMSDVNNEELLAQLYSGDSFGGGYILSALTGPDGKALVGKAITESIDNVVVSFEKIYRVEVAADNDGRYELSDSFRFLNATKNDRKYRFITETTASSLLTEADSRSGFTLAWDYSFSGAERRELTSLRTAIDGLEQENLTVYPVWTLNAPTITLCDTEDGYKSYVYGDSVELVCAANAPVSTVDLTYTWYQNGKKLTDADFERLADRIKIDDAAEYSLVVTAHSDTVTTLTSTSSSSFNIAVTKKQLPVTWRGLDGGSEFSRVYTAESSAISLDYDGTVLVYDDDTVTYDISIKNVTKAGSYNPVITLTGDCAEKYFVSSSQSSQNYVIEKKTVDIEWTVDEYRYTKSEIAPKVVITNGICLADDLSVRTAGQILPGNYTAIATLYGSDSANYVIKSAQLKQDYTIQRALIKFEWDAVTQTYNSKDLSPTVTPIGLCGDDKAADLKITVSKAKNAGTHVITVKIDHENYVIEDGANTHNFVIEPAPIVLEYKNTSKTYNAALQKPTVAVQTELFGDDTVQGLSLTVTGATDAGTHEVTASITNKNYVIQNPTYDSFKINQAPIEVIWDSENSLVYNGENQHLAVKSYKGVFEKDEDKVTVVTDVESSAFKNYSSTPYTSFAKLTDSTGNYYLTDKTAKQEYYITKKPLELTWSDTEFDYDGNPHRPTAVIKTALIAGDSVSILLSEAKTNAALKHTVTATVDNENYSITNATQAFTINQKKIEVTWTNLEFVYDGKTHTPTASVNPADLLAGDTVTVTVSGGQKNAAEKHTATAKTSNSNYYITNATKDYSIDKLQIEITWANTNLTYTGKAQAPTASATIAGGMIKGDNVLITVSGGQKNVGNAYEATATTANTNYVISNDKQSFNISPLTVEVVFSSTELTYNGKAQKPTVTLKGAPAGDNYGLVVKVNGSTTGATKVGTYNAEVSTTNTNYVLDSSTVTSDFVIKPKTLTVSWTATTQTFNGSALKPTASLNGVVSGENVDVTLTVNGSVSGKTNAGEYTAVITINDSNYQLDTDTSSKKFKIQKATVSVTWDKNEFTYNGKAQAPVASAGSLTLTYKYEKYDAATKTYTVISSKPKEAGDYRVTVSTSNANYELTNETMAFSIEAAKTNK